MHRLYKCAKFAYHFSAVHSMDGYDFAESSMDADRLEFSLSKDAQMLLSKMLIFKDAPIRVI